MPGFPPTARGLPGSRCPGLWALHLQAPHSHKVPSPRTLSTARASGPTIRMLLLLSAGTWPSAPESLSPLTPTPTHSAQIHQAGNNSDAPPERNG